ncbi:MAG: transcriptional regulator [Acidobacteria bacterium]|nr:transcriptional regulator [Acidobacteriota bacterium]
MSKENKELYEFDKFCLDVSERFLLKNGKRVALADRAFDTLCVLVRRGNRLVSKDELMTEVWADAIVEENNLDKNISALRRILGERGGKQTFIETVRGHGYRFVAEVQQIQTDMETRQHGDTAMSEPSAPMGGSNAAKSQISNHEFQTGNRDGDERPAGNKHPIEEQRPKSIDRIENPKSKIQNRMSSRLPPGDTKPTQAAMKQAEPNLQQRKFARACKPMPSPFYRLN